MSKVLAVAFMLATLLLTAAAAGMCDCNKVYNGEMADSLTVEEQNAIWDENSQYGEELLKEMAACPKEDGSCLPPYNNCNVFGNCSCYTADQLLQLRNNNSFCIEGWDCYLVGDGRGEYSWNETENDPEDHSSGEFVEGSYPVFDGNRSYVPQALRITYNGTVDDYAKNMTLVSQMGNKSTYYQYTQEEVKLGLPRSQLRGMSEQW